MEGATGIVVGNCRLETEIGRGGTGTVYRARQLGVNRLVAVKLIPISSDGPETADRFEREAQAAGRLDHPHCLPVYAAGEQDGLLYLVMRLVDGSDLADLLRAEGPLGPERAVVLLEQVASAVDYAHRSGLVHRDLKPANILIEPDGGTGHAYVSDFGLMRSLADSPITLTGQWVGTPQFAAPEQQRGEQVGPAADIYALGRVLAQMLGTHPPPSFRPVLDRATHSDPRQRYASAGELAVAARAGLAPPSPAPAGLALHPTVVNPTAVTVAQPRAAGGPTRWARRGVAVALVAVMGAAVAAAVIVLSRHHRSGDSSRSAPSTTTPSTESLVATGYTAALPAGWTIVVKDAVKPGYRATQVQSPDGAIAVTIDHDATSAQSLSAHARSVEAAAQSTTPDYHLDSLTSTTINDTPAVVWRFSGDSSQRADVFRQIGDSQFAVLAVSQSMADSLAAATRVAESITLR